MNIHAGKRALTAALALVLTAGLWAAGSKDAGSSAGAAAPSAEPYRFRFAYGPWDAGRGKVELKDQPGNPYFQWVEQRLGVVPLTESWEWQGGSGYVQSLRLALASGEKFEAIRPWDMQLTQELIDSGIAVPLDDLLDKYAPTVKAAFSKEQWDMVRAAGKGKIYYLPQYGHVPGLRAGMVRKDWLKRAGIDKVPETRQEYVAMLRAFKAKDANGNGDPADEFPVSGREMLRWFDDLFVMHGVVMYEGHPQWKWNAAKGIFESQQVSDDMKDAVAFIRELYAEGLMDNVMPVQKSADWQAKISSDKVGTYFHLLGEVASYSKFAADKADKDESGLSYWDVMPMPPQVEGKPRYKNVYPVVQEPTLMITKYAKDPAAIMKWFEFSSTQEGQIFKDLGIEGKDYVREGNTFKVLNPLPAAQLRFLLGYTAYVPDVVRSTALGPAKVAMIDKVKAAGVQDLEAYNLPPATYKGFEDYAPATAKLYREYVSKMIIGALPMSAWDDYVKEWYAKGGQTVTERATQWYKGIKGIK